MDNKEIIEAIDLCAELGILEKSEAINARVEIAYELIFHPEENQIPDLLDLENTVFNILYSEVEVKKSEHLEFYTISLNTDIIKEALNSMRFCYQEKGCVYNYPQTSLF
jgi:hypothetical protein